MSLCINHSFWHVHYLLCLCLGINHGDQIYFQNEYNLGPVPTLFMSVHKSCFTPPHMSCLFASHPSCFWLDKCRQNIFGRWITEEGIIASNVCLWRFNIFVLTIFSLISFLQSKWENQITNALLCLHLKSYKMSMYPIWPHTPKTLAGCHQLTVDTGTQSQLLLLISLKSFHPAGRWSPVQDEGSVLGRPGQPGGWEASTTGLPTWERTASGLPSWWWGSPARGLPAWECVEQQQACSAHRVECLV